MNFSKKSEISEKRARADKSAPTVDPMNVLRQGTNEIDSSSRTEMSSRVILSPTRFTLGTSRTNSVYDTNVQCVISGDHLETAHGSGLQSAQKAPRAQDI